MNKAQRDLMLAISGRVHNHKWESAQRHVDELNKTEFTADHPAWPAIQDSIKMYSEDFGNCGWFDGKVGEKMDKDACSIQLRLSEIYMPITVGQGDNLFERTGDTKFIKDNEDEHLCHKYRSEVAGIIWVTSLGKVSFGQDLQRRGPVSFPE